MIAAKTIYHVKIKYLVIGNIDKKRWIKKEPGEIW